MLDYLEVKKFYAEKLREDAYGTGRVESAFYHTMKMVYLKGVEDGERANCRAHTERDTIVGVEDHRPTATDHVHAWFRTGGMASGEQRCIHCGAWSIDRDSTPPALA